jgi:type I restriction enzyme R subunit
VPTNGSIFFTIFQTFMSGKLIKKAKQLQLLWQYPKDYFDFIIIDECHRGGANDEGNWRGILEYFSPAVQLGLTATPKRKTMLIPTNILANRFISIHSKKVSTMVSLHHSK